MDEPKLVPKEKPAQIEKPGESALDALPARDTADHAIEMLRHRYGRRYNSSARTDEQVWETKWTDVHVVGEEAIEARLRFLKATCTKL